MPYFLNPNIQGITLAAAVGDGYGISLKWAKAYPTNRSYKIAYNIYMSSEPTLAFTNTFFSVNNPSFVSIDGTTTVEIIDLVPGQMYRFAVRAFEYDPTSIDLTKLEPTYNGLYVLPQSLLAQDISSTDGHIKVLDISSFPSSGISTNFKIGGELINYSSINYEENTFVLTNTSIQRGFYGTLPTEHTIDGYDGYIFWNPYAILWPIENEEQNTVVYECWNRFDVGNYAFTTADGYRQTTSDILTTDLVAVDQANNGFPAYSFSGYNRTDPVLILNGTCVGSYIGGYQYCADANTGVGMQIRGISVQDANTQRQEVLLSTTGEPVCLIKKEWTGITCKCFLPSNEQPLARCSRCFGTGKVSGWTQFFDSRRSDGRIMVRFDPSVDSVVATESGLESTMAPTCWTLVWPTLKSWDFIVRFDQDGNEEFRYEILNVTRNKTFLDGSGAQKFALQRIRKTDIIYQVPVFRNTAMFPYTSQTSVDSSNGLIAHSHSFVLNEMPSHGARQMTGVSQAHNHPIVIDPATGTLKILPVLGHNHTLF